MSKDSGSLSQTLKEPIYAIPVLTTIGSAVIYGLFSLTRGAIRRNIEENKTARDGYLTIAKENFNKGENFLKEKKYHEAEKSFRLADEQFEIYGDYFKKNIKKRKDVIENRKSSLINQSKALYFQGKLVSDHYHLPSALNFLEKCLRLGGDAEGFRLRGLIYLKLAYFKNQHDSLEKALADFASSYKLESQSFTYHTYLFTESLIYERNLNKDSTKDEKKSQEKKLENYKTMTQKIESGSDSEIFSSQLLWMYAEAFYHLKNYSQAIAYIKTAIKTIDSNNPTFFYEKEKLYRRCADFFIELSKDEKEIKTIEISIWEGYKKTLLIPDPATAGIFAKKHNGLAENYSREQEKISQILSSQDSLQPPENNSWCTIS